MSGDSFFLIRGESTMLNSYMEEGSSIDMSDEFKKFDVMIKPKGNKISRFFSASYQHKDLYIYLDGTLIIRERPRDLNHSIQLMLKPPFEQVHVKDVS